ncbi:efflux transporter outer membrane subunit [Methylocystis bryophila]|uniref:RND transporter n=1 Tax=Methylocystis bryophila TaxID=655015 RepID=A0A1W6MTD8_9HYPH|nr:efflux transporter outer membrane subunit [Methylocystis bryophila]ARN80786.1 RND transporter [Methylocystis bryophila]BDV40870.1 RND transporter [Methylocystis bryophila]
MSLPVHIRRCAGLIALCAMLALAGCDLEWEKPDLATPLPERFRAAAPTSAPSFHSAHEFAGRFGSAELTRVIDEALAGNNDIAAAVARITEADAQARVSSAPLFPTLSNVNNFERLQIPSTVYGVGVGNSAGLATASSTSSSPFGARRIDFYSLGLNASYTLDIWGVNQDASKAARLLANASRFNRQVVEIATVASTLNAYFAVLNAQDQLRIVNENARIAGKVLTALKARREVGLATVLDVAQQQTVYDTQLAMIPPLQQTLAQQINLLAVLLGRTPESFSIQGTTLKRLHFPKIDPGLPSEVLLRRPDVAEAEARLASQEFSVLQARAAFFPQIQLTGQYGVESIVWRNLATPQAIFWQVLATTTQPLFDGWNLQGQYELQKGKYSELAANYRKQTLTALSDTENALIAIAQTQRHLSLQEDSVASARQALTAAQARLSEGTIDIVTLATNETAYFQGQLVLEQVRLARYQAATTFYQALGGGWSATTREAEIARADAAYETDKGLWP